MTGYAVFKHYLHRAKPLRSLIKFYIKIKIDVIIIRTNKFWQNPGNDLSSYVFNEAYRILCHKPTANKKQLCKLGSQFKIITLSNFYFPKFGSYDSFPLNLTCETKLRSHDSDTLSFPTLLLYSPSSREIGFTLLHLKLLFFGHTSLFNVISQM